MKHYDIMAKMVEAVMINGSWHSVDEFDLCQCSVQSSGGPTSPVMGYRYKDGQKIVMGPATAIQGYRWKV